MRYLALCSAVLPSLFSLSVVAESPSAAPPTSEPFQQLLQLLQSTNDVNPSLPDVHPVHTVTNSEAIIPPQCYTQTAGEFNPCYVCHQDEKPGNENTMNDGALQIAYSFSDVGMTNHWKNLFEDRSEAVAKITDQAIDDWVRQDNYSSLAPRLRKAGFDGWIPDLSNLHLGAEAFDDQGFAKDGSHWVAFNYKPLPSTFWPTNGSTDDVMIRLPAKFRNIRGSYSKDVYLANLAILEASVKNLSSIVVPSIDEKSIEVDLNGDGTLSNIEHITKVDRFVGDATKEFRDSYLYPEGTEFLHTVRYVGIAENGDIKPSTRMKEVRYMRKSIAYRKSIYSRHYQLEGYAKEIGQLPQYVYLGDKGLDNGYGWALQGFIENKHGELRTLTYEENLFCMGCHSSIGATIDKTFSLPRKVDGVAGWGYINLKGMADAPNRGETLGEIATYLQRVGGGGEFRSNDEMYARWFNSDGSVKLDKIAKSDVYTLIAPSHERARELNKAYRVIVDDQDFIFGRDATVTPPKNVYEFIDNKTAPTLSEDLFHAWDIRLDWSHDDRKELTLQ
ncbi:hypothetical protein [Aurantivibrio plasticivorans]